MSGLQSYQFGHAAEDHAAALYQAQGAEVVARRFKVREGEVDLIAKLGDQLVFIEVKARRSLEDAAAAINPRQWRRVADAALAYLNASNLSLTTDVRFDAVLMDRSGQSAIVENVTM